MKNRMATTSLEAFYGASIHDWSNKERQVMAAFTSREITYTRQQLARVVHMPLHGVCGRVRSLLDKSALVVRGESKCRTTGKYRELLGLPEVQV